MYDALFERGGMSLERLRRFCEVVSAKSIADAVAVNRRAATSYSRDIAALEAYFGHPLFRRSRGGSRSGRRLTDLTPFGRAIHEWATSALRRMEGLLDFTPQARPLRLGGGEWLLDYFCAKHMPTLRERLADRPIHFTDGRSEWLLQELREGRLDLVLVEEPALSLVSFSVRATPVGACPLSLFTHSALQHEDLNDLLALPLVLLNTFIPASDQSVRLPAPDGNSARVRSRVSSVFQAQRLLSAMDCAALLPDVTAERMAQAGYVRHLLPESVACSTDIFCAGLSDHLVADDDIVDLSEAFIGLLADDTPTLVEESPRTEPAG